MTRLRSVGFGFLVAVAATLVAPSLVSGQIAWDTPRMVGPDSPGGFGLFWLHSGTLPGDGDAAYARLTVPGTGGSFSLRGGFGEGVAGENSAFGGVDLRAPIARHTDTQPLDIEWTGGLGVGVGLEESGYILGSLPLAVAAGRSWSSGSVWFSPYVSVGGVLEYRYGEEAPDEEFGVDSLIGVGLDVAFDEGRNVVVSAAASLGDRQAISVGLVFGGG